MKRLYSILLLTTLLLAACVPVTSQGAASTQNAPAAPPAEEAMAASEPIPDSEFDILPDFDPNDFSNPTVIDNQWFPLQPGTQLIYEGVTQEGEEAIPHQIIMTVTDLTKEVAGVRSVVMWDRDFSDGALEEAEIALFAQADDGTVWHFGQYPEVYENGELIETPAWFAGYADAQPGITIKAEPEIGGSSYSQGWGPAVGWTDRARAVRFEDQVCVATGCYDGVLVTEETAREEQGAFQLKYYAPGIGNIKVNWSGTDTKKEVLELVEIKQLTTEEMAAARAAALELEANAYANVPEVYGETAPME